MSLYDALKETFLRNKVLFKNFSSLSILQLSQYLFPLITFPYLVRVLGPEGYGLVAFATAFVGYFTIITDYGFNLSATRKISINRKNIVKVSEIFCSVIIVKLILFLVCSLFILPIIFGFNKFSENATIYLISYLSVLGTAIFPIWFFQGTERMSYITIINVIVKIIWVVFVFLLVKDSQDIIILVTLNSISILSTGIIGLFAVKIYFKIKIKFPTYSQLKFELQDGWYYFISQASLSLYTISNVFILGVFSNNTIVGYFAAADKIRTAVQNITGTAGRTIFPHLSFEFTKSKKAAFNFINKYLKTVGSFTVLISLLLFVLAEEIILTVLGTEYLESILILKILSILPVVILLSNIAGIQIMLNLDFKKEFANILVFAGVFNIIISLIIVPLYFGIGTSISLLLTEIIVTVLMLIFLKSKKINIFKKIIIT